VAEFEDVGAFHVRFGLDNLLENDPGEREWDDALVDFRARFMQEELNEFMDATMSKDHAGMADALVDLVYVAMGTAHLMGYPWQQLWDEVQRANIAKVRAQKDGSDSVRGSSFDVVKPPGWQPPDIEKILKRNGF
jgi:predicted HAD superfamily Cof-like phosphohydrolase